MVGLVLVSHSKKLAESVRELVLQMTGRDFPIAVASGAGKDHNELGTDAVHIADVLNTLSRPDGVLVLMDVGSAVLSAEAALQLLDNPPERTVVLCAAPLVEGAVAAAAQANAGGSLEEVAREAKKGLLAKQQQLEPRDNRLSAAEEIASLSGAAGQTAEIVLTVENEHGLHARPAAAFVRAVSKFSSAIQIANLTSGLGPVSARSLTSVALLQVGQGDRIRLLVTGADRNAALQAIRELARNGFGEAFHPGALPAKRGRGAATLPAIEGEQVIGQPGSDGIAIGPLLPLEGSLLPLENEPAGDPASEWEKLNRAMNEVAQELSRDKLPTPGTARESGEILEAQALILSDPVLLERLRARLEDEHTSAGSAWIGVTEELAAQYRSMKDEYLRERAADVHDIARRVVHRLGGTRERASIHLDRPSILFARELLPSEAAVCNPATVLGVITHEGSTTSHSAIVLRTLGIPMVVGAYGLNESAIGKVVAVDGGAGQIWIEPAGQTVAALEKRSRMLLDRQKQISAARFQPCITFDGVRMEVLANIGSAEDASTATENGAEGIGLLRTEFLFVLRNDAPSEEEQVRTLRGIFAFVSGPIIVRTLDAGADKPLPFLPQPAERNPHLGVRGIRLCLRFPELFLAHLRAILAAGVDRHIWLMFPMISTIDEVHGALQTLERAHRELATQGRPHAWPVKRGAMIEVPSGALMIEELADELDFFSIGTNDLTQYVMAAERGNPSVAELQDALQPAVLRLVKTVVDGARSRRHVSVCGDAASDPVAAAIFAGLGIRSLSVRPKQVAQIKAFFHDSKTADLSQLAEAALGCRDAAQVRKLARDRLYGAAVVNRDS